MYETLTFLLVVSTAEGKFTMKEYETVFCYGKSAMFPAASHFQCWYFWNLK